MWRNRSHRWRAMPGLWRNGHSAGDSWRCVIGALSPRHRGTAHSRRSRRNRHRLCRRYELIVAQPSPYREAVRTASIPGRVSAGDSYLSAEPVSACPDRELANLTSRLRYKRQRGGCLVGSEIVVQNSRDICDSTPDYRKIGTGQWPIQKGDSRLEQQIRAKRQLSGSRPLRVKRAERVPMSADKIGLGSSEERQVAGNTRRWSNG